jgi:hypothetical protein
LAERIDVQILSRSVGIDIRVASGYSQHNSRGVRIALGVGVVLVGLECCAGQNRVIDARETDFVLEEREGCVGGGSWSSRSEGNIVECS